MTFGKDNYKVKTIGSLSGGLNTREDPEEISDGELSDCENIEIDEKVVKSAAGYVQHGALARGKYWGTYQFKKSTGTQTLLRQRGALLEYDSDGSGTWVTCTLPTSGSPATTVTLTQTYCTFATLNDTVLWSNGTDSVMSSTDGITWTLQSSLPKAQVILHNGKNRMMFLVQPSDPGRVDWSDINAPTTVNASSYQWIGKNDGQELKGVGIDEQGNITFFKDRNVYSISDITAGMVAVDPIGTLPFTNHRTIATTENSLLVAGVDGVYEVQGGVIRHISEKINWTGGRNKVTQFESWCATYHNGIYRLAIPDADVDNTYNCQEYLLYKKMYRNDVGQPYPITRNRRYIGCYGTEEYETAGTVRRRLYFGDSRSTAPSGSPASDTDIYAYINDSHDTSITQGLNGSAQTCNFRTKFFTENIPFLIKKFRKFFTRIKNDNDLWVTVRYRYDPQGGWTETTVFAEASDYGLILEDSSESDFSEGYGFSQPLISTLEKDLEAGLDPRGIQFEIEFSTTTNVYFTSFSYNFLPKLKLR